MSVRPSLNERLKFRGCTLKKKIAVVQYAQVLAGLKYYVPIAYLEQVTSISRCLKFRYKNESEKNLFTIVKKKHSVV